MGITAAAFADVNRPLGSAWLLRKAVRKTAADILGMARVLSVLGAALFCILLASRADANCLEAKALRGNVRSVLISQGKVDVETGAARNKPHRWERWDVSRDRRTVRVIQYSADGFSLLPLFNLWPTTTCEFDEADRLFRVRLRLNGLTTYSMSEMRHDAQGRLLETKVRSRNPELSGDTAYEYSGNVVTERFNAGSSRTTLTERDTWGRVAKEIRRGSTGEELSTLDYLYGPDTVEIVGRENGKSWRVVRKMDSRGNMIESSFFGEGSESRDVFRFDYDRNGNWIRRVTVRAWDISRPPQVGEVDIREITYWR